ncbi:MAG: homoserine dehydrogenase [Lachnospiraceae bacterium]|nr:homoserine dehydrogenase [Lachnospiraceae bacterium]
MKKIIKAGMLGIGNIGKGTYQALEMNRAKIEETTGLDIEIVKILNRDPDRDRGIDIPKSKYTTDVQEILTDPGIDIVIELIGGIEPATTYMAEALRNGKSVVTANKAAIAANGKYLAQLAQDNHVLLRFEAAVAGGIPILTSLTTALLSNKFTAVHGILNGTTNYILTQMGDYGKDYAEVLKDAQAKGFAEADPTADVEGIDAANKLSILLSLVFGIGAGPDVIPTHGITAIGREDIAFAKSSGYKIKLLASAHEEDGKVSANVEPALVPKRHPIASVDNEFNAVFVTGNAVDNLMFYGRGAGPLPTGSAVLGDVIGVARKLDKDSAYDVVPQLRYDSGLEYIGEGANKYYVRMSVPERAGILGQITTILGKYGISIETIEQKTAFVRDGVQTVPLIFIFMNVKKSLLLEALDEILNLEDKVVFSVDNIMRVVK